MFWQWLAALFSGAGMTRAAQLLAADIAIKVGVAMAGVDVRLVAALNRAQSQLRARGLGLRITSATGGRHRQGSKHYRGLAVDVTPRRRADGWDPVIRRRLVNALEAQGLRVVDEYASPSALSTGGHLHVELEA